MSLRNHYSEVRESNLAGTSVGVLGQKHSGVRGANVPMQSSNPANFQKFKESL